MSGVDRLASSVSGGRNTGALTCPSPLAALQGVEGISILLSRTRESFLSEAVRKFWPNLDPHFSRTLFVPEILRTRGLLGSFRNRPTFLLSHRIHCSCVSTNIDIHAGGQGFRLPQDHRNLLRYSILCRPHRHLGQRRGRSMNANIHSGRCRQSFATSHSSAGAKALLHSHSDHP